MSRSDNGWCLPQGVERGALAARLDAVRQDAESSTPPIPGEVIRALDAAARALREEAPDLSAAAAYAGGILAWYFDQGFAEVPAHAALAGVAVSLVKMARLCQAIAAVEQLASGPGVPQWAAGVKRLLVSLQEAFSADGSLDTARYDRAIKELRELARPYREYWQTHAPAVLEL